MEKDEKTNPQIVQTYVEDMAKAIKDDKNGGLIKKIIHGEEEHEEEKKNMSPESKKNRIIMSISILLISIGVGILFIFFSKMNTSSVVPVEKTFTPLIFNDKTTFLPINDLSKDEIAQTIQNEANNTNVKNGGVEGIYLTLDKKVAGLRKFMSLLESNLVIEPLNDTINFVSDNFLLGVVRGDSQNNTKDLFILIKVQSLPDVFGSFRTWENKMFYDLHNLFGIALSSETSYLLTKNFEPGIIDNKNASILYDNDRKIVMMYVFADDHSVVIANSENAVYEIVRRLASSQVEK